MDIEAIAILNTLVLMTALIIKHFFADYVLQTRYMLKKSAPTGWEFPLLLHCLVHCVLTLIVVCSFVDVRTAVTIFFFELTIHFVIDAIKARPSLLGRYAPSEKAFWVSLGFDQMIHYLTYIAIAYLVLL